MRWPHQHASRQVPPGTLNLMQATEHQYEPHLINASVILDQYEPHDLINALGPPRYREDAQLLTASELMQIVVHV